MKEIESLKKMTGFFDVKAEIILNDQIIANHMGRLTSHLSMGLPMIIQHYSAIESKAPSEIILGQGVLTVNVKSKQFEGTWIDTVNKAMSFDCGHLEDNVIVLHDVHSKTSSQNCRITRLSFESESIQNITITDINEDGDKVVMNILKKKLRQ